mmetsp:Transcript_7488/g.14630  ORF Transcript_7488/g.14630 Transcript_7488/m.14630 type:complete len:391 (-) Transcript_7488:177-1349(-)
MAKFRVQTLPVSYPVYAAHLELCHKRQGVPLSHRDDIRCRHCCHLLASRNCSTANMRQHHAVGQRQQRAVDRQRLRYRHVEPCCGDFSRLERCNEVLLHHHLAPGGIDKDGVLPHHLEPLEVEVPPRVLVEREHRHHKVCTLKQLLLRHKDSTHTLRLGLWPRSRVDDLAPKRLEPPRHRLPDAAKAHDPHRGRVHVLATHPQGIPRAPAPVAHRSNCLAQAAGRSHQQHDGGVGRGLGEAVGGVPERDGPRLERPRVDVVEAHAHRRHQLQPPPRRVHELAVDLVRQQAQQRVAPLGQLFLDFLAGHRAVAVGVHGDLCPGDVPEHLESTLGDVSSHNHPERSASRRRHGPLSTRGTGSGSRQGKCAGTERAGGRGDAVLGVCGAAGVG